MAAQSHPKLLLLDIGHGAYPGVVDWLSAGLYSVPLLAMTLPAEGFYIPAC